MVTSTLSPDFQARSIAAQFPGLHSTLDGAPLIFSDIPFDQPGTRNLSANVELSFAFTVNVLVSASG